MDYGRFVPMHFRSRERNDHIVNVPGNERVDVSFPGLSIGYWFSVNSASSTFIISVDFLIVLTVSFNFHFKRTR